MANQVTPQTPQSYLRTISIIHIALFMGNLLFAIVAINVYPNKGINLNGTGDVFFCVVPLLAIGCFLASIFVFKKQVNIAGSKFTLKEKLMAYQAALIQRYALLNGASMFGIVVYMLTGNLFYIIIVGFLMLFLLMFRPTKDKIENDLNLSYEDKILFDNEDQLR